MMIEKKCDVVHKREKPTPYPLWRRLTGLIVTIGLVGCVQETESVSPEPEANAPQAKGLLPRIPIDKNTLMVTSTPEDPEQLVIKFNEGTDVALTNTGLLSRLAHGVALPTSAGVKTRAALDEELTEVDSILSETGVSLKRMFKPSVDTLLTLKRKGESRSKKQLANMNLYFNVPRSAFASVEEMAEARDALNRLSIVEGAYIQPKAVVPASTTPDFTSYQSYKGPAPQGIDADYAADPSIPGGRGQGVTFVDIEYGWNANHEDLPDLFPTLYTSTPPGSADHGTAVLGIVCAEDNGFGMTGIAPDSRCGYSNTDAGTPQAIVNALQVLSAGDIILLELHYGGAPKTVSVASSDANLITVEFFQAEFDAIQLATASGITVVEAAGNGFVNLDHDDYFSRFDRGVRDSGAIIVGASYSTSRAPKDFSNTGTRVDVHAWGENVATLGYGQLHGGDVNTLYTDGFGGTSSASAIIGGVATAIQGVALAAQNIGAPLEPEVLRALLTATGTPQTGDMGRPIGPQPNMRDAIDTLLSGAPIPDFAHECNATGCQFNATSTDLDGTVVSHNWTFGDGGSSSALNPSHAYSAGGIYTVSLTATDNSGQSNTIERKVLVHDDTCVLEQMSLGSASASSQSAGAPASAAIDGDLDTEWHSAPGNPQWLAVDLGAREIIDAVAITWAGDNSSNFEIQVSDTGQPGSWMPVYISYNPAWDHQYLWDLRAEGRYVRVYSHVATNASAGFGIKELEVHGYADPQCANTTIECTDVSDCNDGKECTVDVCRADGICLRPAVSWGTACASDNNICTDDICIEGTCEHPASALCRCDDDVDCDDNNECTQDKCDDNGFCINSRSTGSLCQDEGNSCTIDVCAQGECVHLQNGSCSCNNDADCDDGNLCTDDVCQPNGTCRNNDVTDYTPCDSDTNQCTDQYCFSGFCLKETPTDKPCNDGDPCTVGDVCTNAQCFAVPMNCDDNDSCTDDWCDYGVCQNVSNGTCGGCTDDNWCDDGNPYTVNTCNPDGTCSTVNANDGSTCNDDGNPCTDHICVTGICYSTNNADACDDGNSCTTNDTCSAGTCSGTAMSCDDGDPCTDDYCSAGTCQHPDNGTCQGGGPCDGICSNPVVSNAVQNPNIGTGERCIVRTATINGGNCGNFAWNRSLTINGTQMPCNWQNWSAIPAPVSGGYCIHITAGNYPWTGFTAW